MQYYNQTRQDQGNRTNLKDDLNCSKYCQQLTLFTYRLVKSYFLLYTLKKV